MAPSDGLITLFMAGDVMTGRGIDQILPHPSPPFIPESYLQDAREYVRLAERLNGPITKPVPFEYIWGNTLSAIQQRQPHVRLINLETSVTRWHEYWPDKGINYRMHPGNIPCLTAAAIDCCVLANNHVLDWGYPGLTETLDTLLRSHIQTAGAGPNQPAAAAPAILPVSGHRLLVFSLGSETSGIPARWRATQKRAGVNLLPDFSKGSLRQVTEQVRGVKRRGDIAIASIHWGRNWGYGIPADDIAFAHQLIDQASVDIVHGHSSHHVKGVEVYKGRLILYGCGDLINDYEGIGGYETYRDDLSLMYFAGTLQSLHMVPTQMRRFQLHLAEPSEVQWLATTMDRECRKFGHRVQRQGSDLVLIP